MNWEIKKLVEVTDLITCGVAKRPDYVDTGIPFLSAKNVKNGRVIWNDYRYISEETHAELTKNNKPRKGDILYTRVGSFGEAAIIDEDKEFSIFVSLTLIKTKDEILNSFLKYYLNSYSVKLIAKNSISGSGVGNLNVGTVRNFLVPVPPIAEQKRIVGILDEAFEGCDRAIRNTEKNLANSRELFESYLNAIFTQKGDRWENTKSKFVPLSTILSEQPRNGWSPPAIFQTGEGTPVLTLSAVTGFKYDSSRIKMSSAPTKDNAHYWLKEGELLITRSNTRELVGHVAIYDGNPQKAICCDLIMKMTVDFTKADTRFVYYYLRSLSARKYLTGKATGASETMPKITKSVVQEVPILIFTLAEQKNIVKKLDEIAAETQHLEAIYKQKLSALNELKQSILQKAFTGRLTKDS